MKNNKLFSTSLLVSVAGIWGIAFVSMKTTLERLDVFSFLAWRFLIATLVLTVIRPRVIKSLNLNLLKKGMLIGAFLGSGYVLQSIGLTKSTVGKTGFITGLYVVLTPLISFFFLKKKIARWDWISAFLAAIGLGLLAFKGFGVGLGESLVFASAILFAIHIVALSEWASSLDVYALTTVQLGTCALITFFASLNSGFKSPPDSGVWAAIIFTAIFATAFAFIVQTWAQSFIPSTTVAVILTLEAVFALVFGLILLKEALTIRVAIGGFLVMAAMYLIIIFGGENSIREVTNND